MSKFLNLACGNVFLRDAAWVNADFQAMAPWVQSMDLLAPLPFSDHTFDLVYCSHFLEHIPRELVSGFLRECYRVLRPGGLIRLVLPDADEMFRQYLRFRDTQQHAQADFLMIEIVDQCVRSRSGGLLTDFYRQILALPDQERQPWQDFVKWRNGETFGQSLCVEVKPQPMGFAPRLASDGILRRIADRITRKTQRLKHQLGLSLLEPAFCRQNVSLALTGEKHHWLWDGYTLTQELGTVGFTRIQRMSASESQASDFPFYPLDLHADGSPRKGAESMYYEGLRL